MIRQQFQKRPLDGPSNPAQRWVGPCYGFRVLSAFPQDAGITLANMPGGVYPGIVELRDEKSGETSLLNIGETGWISFANPVRVRVVAPAYCTQPASFDWWLIQYATKPSDRLDPDHVPALSSETVSGIEKRVTPFGLAVGGQYQPAVATLRGGSWALAVGREGFTIDSGVVGAGALVTVGNGVAGAGYEEISIVADNAGGAAPRNLNLLTYTDDGATLLDTTLIRTVAVAKKERITLASTVSAPQGPADVYAYTTVLPKRWIVQLAAAGAANGRLIVSLR